MRLALDTRTDHTSESAASPRIPRSGSACPAAPRLVGGEQRRQRQQRVPGAQRDDHVDPPACDEVLGQLTRQAQNRPHHHGHREQDFDPALPGGRCPRIRSRDIIDKLAGSTSHGRMCHAVEPHFAEQPQRVTARVAGRQPDRRTRHGPPCSTGAAVRWRRAVSTFAVTDIPGRQDTPRLQPDHRLAFECGAPLWFVLPPPRRTATPPCAGSHC